MTRLSLELFAVLIGVLLGLIHIILAYVRLPGTLRLQASSCSVPRLLFEFSSTMSAPNHPLHRIARRRCLRAVGSRPISLVRYGAVGSRK